MEGAQGPQAGWYDDPHGGERLRWWDGSQWTAHTHDKPQAAPPAPAPAPAAAPGGRPQIQVNPAPAGTPRGRVPAGPWPWIVAAAALVGVVVLFVALGGGDDEGESGASEQAMLAADSDAKAMTRTVQTAVETFATDHDGSYAEATPEELAAIEPTLDPSMFTLEAAESSYTATVTSQSGNAFSLARADNGDTTYACAEPGVAGCPASGDWSEG